MKRRAVSAIFALCVVPGAWCAPQDSSATLRVTSVPEGLVVFIDGSLAGTTPVASFVVIPGKHIIEVLAPDRYRWIAARAVDTITVTAGEMRSIDMTPHDELVVISIPSDAAVYGDVGLLGRTPFRIPFIGEPAWQTLSFERSGYRPAVVGVRPDSTLLVLVRLELAAGRQEMPDVLEGEGPMTIRDGKGVLVSGAAMVVAGVLSAYSKDRANRAYSTYRQTLDPQALKDVRLYDRLSAVATLTTQISFAAFAYFLMAK